MHRPAPSARPREVAVGSRAEALELRPRCRSRALVAGGVLAATLVPVGHTWTAVAWCAGGPLACLAAGALLARLPRADAVHRGLERLASAGAARLLGMRPAVFCVSLATVSLALCAAGASFLLERTPGAFDGALYLFAAKTLAAGRLVAPPPPIAEFFRTPYAILEPDRWYPQYPLGYPALLALGVLLGAPWLVNPVLTALDAVLVYRLGRRLAPEADARIAALIAGLSPFAILVSSDFMSHASSLFCVTAFLLATTAFVQGAGAGSLLAAGLAGGFAFAIRPFSAVGACLVFALSALATALRRRAWGALAAGLLGAAPPLLGLALYDAATTGDPLKLGYVRLQGIARTPGYGIAHGGIERWLEAARHTAMHLNALEKDLFQLPLPGLALAAAAFVLRRPGRFEVALGASFASLVLLYAAYPAVDLYLGPRFYFEGLSALAILSARGLTASLAWLRSAAVGPERRRLLAFATLAGVLLLWPVALVARARQVRAGYSDPAIVRAVEQRGPEKVLVFAPDVPPAQRIACFAANAPALDGRLVCARELGAADEELRARFPGRRAFRWEAGRLVELP